MVLQNSLFRGLRRAVGEQFLLISLIIVQDLEFFHKRLDLDCRLNSLLPYLFIHLPSPLCMTAADIARLSELEQLLRKESYPIAVLNGTPRVFDDGGERLRVEGYTMDEYVAPRVGHLLPRDERLKKLNAQEKRRLRQASAIAIDAVSPFVDQRYRYILINCGESRERSLFYGGVLEIVADNHLRMRTVTLPTANYDKLFHDIHLGRAQAVYFHKIEAFVRAVPHDTYYLPIMRSCARVEHFLREYLSRSVDEARQCFGPLQEELLETHRLIQEKKPTAGGRAALLLHELSFRLEGVHSLIYGTEIAQDGRRA